MACTKWNTLTDMVNRKIYFSFRDCTLIILTLFGVQLLTSQETQAEIWVPSGDERTRHHIQNLVDNGVFSTPITSWPIMWVNVKQHLDTIDPKNLSASELWSYQYLRHTVRQSTRKITFDKRIYISNSEPAITDFYSDAREKHEVQLGIGFVGNNMAGRIQFNGAHEPFDQREVRLDGSYLSRRVGNWAIGIGAIDRWWGPGWQSSMILSNNARPTPGVFFQRNRAIPFSIPILKYLGPWQLTTFMSQLESSRGDHKRTKLWGMRLNFRPIPSLEIGLSRTAMWGGDQRPGDLDTFLKLLIGQDNRGDDGTDDVNEPGNQLAGVDFRFNQKLGNYTSAIYAQLIGEDEANGMPSRHIGLAGLEIQSHWRNGHWRLSLEAQNSMVYFYNRNKNGENSAYEHPAIYSEGYRYHGRTFGASTDNDTESVSLKGQSYFSNGHSARFSVARHRLNYDNKNSDGSTRPFSPEHINTTQSELAYTMPVNNHYAFTLGLFHYSKDITFHDKGINMGGFLQLNARW